MEENDPSHNAVALAAVRDLQTQQNLRLGAPLATKSVLLIKAVLKVLTLWYKLLEHHYLLIKPFYLD